MRWILKPSTKLVDFSLSGTTLAVKCINGFKMSQIWIFFPPFSLCEKNYSTSFRKIPRYLDRCAYMQVLKKGKLCMSLENKNVSRWIAFWNSSWKRTFLFQYCILIAESIMGVFSVVSSSILLIKCNDNRKTNKNRDFKCLIKQVYEVLIAYIAF